MDAVASSNVMRLEEADIHRVTFAPLPPATSFCTLAEPGDSCSCTSACFNTAHRTVQILWQSLTLAAKTLLRLPHCSVACLMCVVWLTAQAECHQHASGSRLCQIATKRINMLASQVWEKVLERLPARAVVITDLESSAEVAPRTNMQGQACHCMPA